MYDGENAMLVDSIFNAEFTGGLEDDEERRPEHWQDCWTDCNIGCAAYNVGDLWLEEMKPEDRERLFDRMADYLGWILMEYDFTEQTYWGEVYKPSLTKAVRGMYESNASTEAFWKLLGRMFADRDFDSDTEKSRFFDWFRKTYEDESWSWVEVDEEGFKKAMRL